MEERVMNTCNCQTRETRADFLDRGTNALCRKEETKVI